MKSVDRKQLSAFADRLVKLADDHKDDVATVIEQAKEAELDTAALRRLVSWRRKDAAKRAEQEAIDEQYRFLAGERETPATPPVGSLLAQAIELYRSGVTVREAAKELHVSTGKAGNLRALAAAFGAFDGVHVHESVDSSASRETAEAA